MEQKETLQFKPTIFLFPTLFVLVIWLIYWIEIKFGFNFNKFGVYPRTLKGFRGVFFTHFIHSNTNHLFNNSIPVFVLLSSLFYFYREVAMRVLLFGAFFTGFFTWLIAQDSYHIGASGIIYLLFSFVFFSGIIRKHYRLVALTLIIIFLYGSMIWYVLPIKEGMSWEGHLSGFLIGFFLSIIYRNKGIKKEPHHFTKTEFDLLFDENGNFNPPKPKELEEEKLEEH